jgi:hypothetical protein
MDFFSLFAVLLGVAALVLAIPPVVSTIWGAPDVQVRFDEGVLDINCKILNASIESKILRAIGTARREPAVTILYRVLKLRAQDIRNEHVVILPTDGFDQSDHALVSQRTLSVGSTVCIIVAIWKDRNKVEGVGRSSREASADRILPPGNYLFELEIDDAAANSVIMIQREFTAGSELVDLRWEAEWGRAAGTRKEIDKFAREHKTPNKTG